MTLKVRLDACRLDLILNILLVAAVVALYGQFLQSPPVFDDFAYFVHDATGQLQISNAQFSFITLRALPIASLAWTMELFGNSVVYLHLGNMALHAAVVLVLYGLVKELLGAETPDALTSTPPKVAQGAAFFAALFFAVHPMAVYSAAYLVQRTMLMATLFCLLAMWAYLRGMRTRNLGWLWLSLPLYYAAVFSKEHAVMLACIFPVLSIVRDPNWRSHIKTTQWLWVSMWLIAVGVTVLKRHLIGQTYEPNAFELQTEFKLISPFASSVVTQTWQFFKYIALWIYPDTTAMAIDIRVNYADSYLSAHTLAALAFLVWGGTALFLIFRGTTAKYFGMAMLFPWAMYFTELVSVRLQEPFVLYRSYLWFAGALAFAATGLAMVYTKAQKSRSTNPEPVHQLNDGKSLIVVALFVALLLFGLSMERLQTFSNAWLLWMDAERLVHDQQQLPGSFRIYYNLAQAELNLGLRDRAMDNVITAIRLQPTYPSGHALLGTIYANSQQWPESVAAHTKAIQLTIGFGVEPAPNMYAWRAFAYEKMNRPELAKADYQTMCRMFQQACNKAQ